MFAPVGACEWQSAMPSAGLPMPRRGPGSLPESLSRPPSVRDPTRCEFRLSR
jgi:hypothetical protein